MVSPGSPAAVNGAPPVPVAPTSADTPTGKLPTAQQWLQSSLRMITVLLDHGASLLVRDEGGASALELAVGAPSVERLIRDRLPAQEAEAQAREEKSRPGGAAADKKKKSGAAPRAAADIKVEIVGGDAKAPPAVGGGCCLVS